MRFDLFLAIEESLDAALTRFRLVGIERMLDAPERDVQRHAYLFPTFDQRPVKVAEKQVLASTTHESFFDLREIVVVIETNLFPRRGS